MPKKKTTSKKGKDKQVADLIQREVYNLFDAVPRESVNRNAVEKLVEKIKKIK